jgi:hypothetical protein
MRRLIWEPIVFAYRKLRGADTADFVILAPPVASVFSFGFDQTKYPSDTGHVLWAVTIVTVMLLCGIARAITKPNQVITSIIVGFAVGFAVIQVPAAVFPDKDLAAPVTQGNGAILGLWCYGWPPYSDFSADARVKFWLAKLQLQQSVGEGSHR